MTIRVTLFIFLLLLCNACCDTSKGCCGDPPNPELTSEAKAWLAPYQDTQYFVFEDQNNRPDTLWVAFETDTEYCGGDECGSQCKIDRATLASGTDTTIVFSIEARNNDNIEINQRRFSVRDLSLFYVRLNLTSGYIEAVPDYVAVEFARNYLFENQEVTAIKARCDSVVTCEEFSMTSMVVSKEKGLIAYTDNSDNNWIRVR